MKDRERKCRGEEGYMVLEACIVVPLFLFMVLTLYGLITIFMAQNMIGHSLMESAQSLALDAYATNAWSYGKNSDATVEWFTGLKASELFGGGGEDERFSNRNNWYDREKGATQEDLVEEVKNRFVAYLAGGDQGHAGDILQAVRIAGGLDGMNFSGTTLTGSDLCVKVDYTIEPLINPFGLMHFSGGQQAHARLWGAALKTDGTEDAEADETITEGTEAETNTIT